MNLTDAMTSGLLLNHGLTDDRLAVHATSALPAWLWSIDGVRVLWANPVGTVLLGARNAGELASRSNGPADPRRRQIVQLAHRLRPDGAVRLERLPHFGAPLGRLLACACSRLVLADGTPAVLIVAAEPVGRPMPLFERLQRLLDGVTMPIAAFARDGLFVGANDAARSMTAFRSLSDAGLDAARDGALKDGRVALPAGVGHIVLQRVGSGADIGLIALLAPGTTLFEPKPIIEPTPAAEVIETPPAAAAVHETPVDATPVAEEPLATFVAMDEDETPEADAPAVTQETLQAHAVEDSSSESDAVAAMMVTPEAPAEFALLDDLEMPQPSENGDDAVERHQSNDSTQAEVVSSETAETEPDDTADAGAEPEHTENPASDINQLEDTEAVAPVTEPATAEEAVADVTPPEGAAAEVTKAEIFHDEPPADVAAEHATPTPAPTPTLPPPEPRRNPLRFTWTIDDQNRFTVRSDDFIRLIGPQTAAHLGRSWPDIADALALDPDRRIASAIASQTTWSGINLTWPVDQPGEPLSVEMAGLPVFLSGHFSGYRGFGVVRDLDALSRLDWLRHDQPLPTAPPHLTTENETMSVDTASDAPQPRSLSAQATSDDGSSHTASPEALAAKPQNVVPIRPMAEPFAQSLTPVENSAFNELARRLSAGLVNDDQPPSSDATLPSEDGAHPEPELVLETETLQPEAQTAANEPTPSNQTPSGDWLSRPPAQAQGTQTRDRPLLDLMPVGMLVYRLDRVLYANPAFLARTGHRDLAALEAGGGLDALYIEPGVDNGDHGTTVTIAGNTNQPPATAVLSPISWDGEPAHALVLTPAPEPETVAPSSEPQDPVPGHATAEDLAAILDTAAEGIVMFDITGKIHSCNRSAEALFGRDGATLTQSSLVDLFAPESLRDVQDYFEAIADATVSSLREHGREVLGRVLGGGLLPLTMTMGRTTPDGPNFFAIFRDQSQARKIDSELLAARKQADRFVSAKADVLARISHEIRTPLNAIIGFSDVMIEERFGTLGNQRYGEYIKDIRACGERVIAIIDDMLNLARIETGNLDLAFASQNLNELVEQCVAVMQPQANRERIIIRTSLGHHLPTVQADARALRQITLNLISNSIQLANAGGQVIVSTATTDSGDVVLRIRDTGHGLNDNEIAAAMEPFRTRAPADRGPDTAAVNLSLTRALVEANRAQFNIKTAPQSGTLVEIVFSTQAAKA
jgi:PAS domain S-box-containing protein